MRNDITIYTATKGNKVILVRTNLSEFLRDLVVLESKVPHRNTIDKNFAKSDDFVINDDCCIQKFLPEQKIDTDLSSENPK